MIKQVFFAPCPRGLESILRAELVELGAQDAAEVPGGVSFSGPFSLCYAANLGSRIASRILWRVYHGPYRNEIDVYQAANRLAWPEWFSARQSIKVKVSSQNCPLKSLEFVTLRIKDAVCDRFRDAAGARPSVNTSRPDIRIDAFLDARSVTLYLDTSGEALFKRGLRAAAGEAPLRENLAAGILRLTGWTPETALLDPMCGSGTILMEAAMIARNIPPGLGRNFAFEKFLGFDARQWRAMCDAARGRQSTRPISIFGSDLDAGVLKAARTNLRAVGLADAVQQADVLQRKAPAAEGILVANPPYGVRLGDQKELEAFYPKLGDALKKNFAGWRAFIFTGDLRLPKLIGLAPSRRTPLFNGALECRLYEFKMVAGSMRRKP